MDMNMDMDTSTLEYKTNVLSQSIGAEQLVMHWHIPEDQRPHVLYECASVTGYGVHFLQMGVQL
jgi:hypothetical protein